MFTTIALFALGLAIPAAVGFFYPIIMERHHPNSLFGGELPIGAEEFQPGEYVAVMKGEVVYLNRER
jgi:hypothetical protein